jgi:hypothetical protein
MTTGISSETLSPLNPGADKAGFRLGCYRDDSGAEAVAIARRYFDRSGHFNVRTHSYQQAQRGLPQYEKRKEPTLVIYPR